METSANDGGKGRPGLGRVGAAAYLMLFLAGLMQAVLGCFYYSSGPVPLAAVGFDLLLLASCLLAAWGMRRPGAGLILAAGWLIAAFVLAMGTRGGSVLITNSSAGAWFLYGGALCAAGGTVTAFFRWSRYR